VTTLTDIAELVRAPAALSVPGDALAGAAVTGTLGARTAGLSAASVCLYWSGMAANDWADRDLDAKERPERPIPSGRVTPGTALGLAAALSAAGLVLAGLAGGRRALAVAAPLTGLMWWYDTGLKGTAAAPAGMAACRGLDVLLGASRGRWRRSAVPALVVAAHTYTVTALSRREVTGGSPLLPAVTLAGTAAIAAGPAIAAGRAMVPAAPSRAACWRRLLPGGLAAWYAASYGIAQGHALAEPSAARMRAAVGAGITSLPALQGALIAWSGAPAAGAAVATAAPLGRRLARWWSPT
jgi:4-hydroxybenzoate polyprenyltransferase